MDSAWILAGFTDSCTPIARIGPATQYVYLLNEWMNDSYDRWLTT